MNRKFLMLLVSMIVAIPVAGQDNLVSTSTLTSGARFEVVQSSYDTGTTFRLDRFSGLIHRLGTCPTDDGVASKKCWKEMIVVDIPKITLADRPRFQIIINGAQKLTTLMHIETGQTWQYGIEPTGKWYPFVECNLKTDFACLWRP